MRPRPLPRHRRLHGGLGARVRPTGRKGMCRMSGVLWGGLVAGERAMLLRRRKLTYRDSALRFNGNREP